MLGGACLLLSLTGHVLAGGPAPSVPALLALAVPVACLCTLVTAERAGLTRIGLTLATTQVGLHEAFMLLAQPHCTVTGMTGHGLHGHGAAAPLTCAGPMAMAGPSVAMLLAHVVAAIGSAVLLAHGERLLWSFLTWLAVTLPQPTRRPLTVALRRTLTSGVRRPARRLLAPGGVGRRGPPALHAA